MKTFKFNQDVKLTIWERHSFEINAETKEEAYNKLMSGINSLVNDESLLSEPLFDGETETLYDTSEYLPLSENSGNPTVELFDEEGNCIWDNLNGIY
jgi:hypothetical protein